MMILIRKRGITDGIYHAEILTTLIQQTYGAVTVYVAKAVLIGGFRTIR